jgi:hypothetical protein
VIVDAYAVWWHFADVLSSGSPTDFWQWFFANVSVQGMLNTAGLGLLALLFARDLILTKAQHERRVADVVKAHDALVANMKEAHAAELRAKDERYADMLSVTSERYSEMKESRDYYREAADELESRNAALTDGVIESNKAMSVAANALQSLENVVKEGS